MLLNYFITSLAAYLGSGAEGSALALGLAIALLAILIRRLTKNGVFALGVGWRLNIALAAVFITRRDSFSGLFPEAMRQLSVFDRFGAFTEGVFDLRALVYMATVCLIFVFFTVQSLEKRRYS
jgi:ABC-2 type transport system permease protein